MTAFRYFSLRVLFVCFLLLIGAASASAQHKLAPPTSTTLLTSDSVRLFVRVAGQGTPCVFVHGGPGAGSYSFEKLGGNRLEAQLRMIYIDQRGSGRSASSPRKDYSVARMVQDLEELRQHLGLERWVVMSHSFGGTIATAYATQHPARVQALVLVNSVLNPPASLESMLHYGTSLLPTAEQPNASIPMMQRFGMVMGALQRRQVAYQLQYSTDSLAARASRVVRAVPANQDFATQVFSGQLPDYGQDYGPGRNRVAVHACAGYPRTGRPHDGHHAPVVPVSSAAGGSATRQALLLSGATRSVSASGQ